MIWTLADHFTTYVKFKDGVLTNSGKKILWPDKAKISSIRYVARLPQFVFRSWGGQVVIYLRTGIWSRRLFLSDCIVLILYEDLRKSFV